ncbi:Permease of the drug/metabolite transporter (DMT) superfamily [Verrucomicrobium sp. GAS474]|uniref:DMT family transporter n=1 Tax=Verrucomicrobium sp. GAS474 TaxID=1882831 RepID=UPI00087D5A56|nr:DMT family transporter [Verrucomicrobium sp. GAS474]SDU16575.1 Permease of the drug/metabolite transporter (DMT) superfamily [Verrucomicrobium sp. GAS474]
MMADPQRERERTGRMLALLSASGFSLKAIFVKLAYAVEPGPVDTVTLLMLRMLLSFPAFVCLAWWATAGRNRERLTARDWAYLLGLAFLGYYLSSLFDFLGLLSISAGLERLILFVYPSMVLLMEAVWKRKPVPKRIWGAIAISYLGLVIAFWHDLRQVPNEAAVWIGGGWVLLATLTYSGYFLGMMHGVARIGSARLAGWSGALACGLVAAHFLAIKPEPWRVLASVPGAVWGWAGAMALVSTVVPIWLAALAVERLGAGRAAAVGMIGPALTIGLGWVILGEPWSVLQVVGLVLVIFGVSRMK